MTHSRPEIDFEPPRRVVIRSRHRKILRHWCASCEANQHLLTLKYAAYISKLTLPQLFSYAEGGQLHFIEAPGGPYVCLDSLCALMPAVQN